MIEFTLWPDWFAKARAGMAADWAAICELIKSEPVRPSKDKCRLIKLATFGDARTDKGSLRHDANVIVVTGIEGDHDAGGMAPEAAIEVLERHHLRAMIYTTWSHTPGVPRWRVLVPLSRPVDPDERLPLAEALNGLLGGCLAPESGALSQSFYIGWPAGAERTTLVTFDDPDEGYCLDELDVWQQYRRPFGAKKPDTYEPTAERKTQDDYLADLLAGDDVHGAALRVVGRMVRDGLTDATIRTVFEGLALKVRETRGAERAAELTGSELARMIAGARSKGYAQPNQAEPAARWPLIWLPDAKPHVSDPALIRGFCKPGAMLICYGESNSGKSFHVLDRDLCLAAGRPWYGRETAGGFVLYVAAEGTRSIETRVAAYRDTYLRDAGAIPFAILPAAIDLRQSKADTRPLIAFVRRIEDERGIKCVKVTVDTLARAMQGGNENASEDMGAVIGHADQIRAEIDCAFEFVHHAGKDTARGARGWSGLRAATDTEIEVVARDGLHTATVTKQRDYGKDGEMFSYRLRVIELGIDPYGHPVTTCVPEWADTPDRSDRKLTRAESAVLAAMHDVMTATRRTPPSSCWDAARPPKPGQYACPLPELREHLRRSGGVSDSAKPDSQDRAMRRAIQSLRDRGIIEVYDDWAWLADKADKGGQNGNCPPAKPGRGADGHGHHPIGVSGLSAHPDGHAFGGGEEGAEDGILEGAL
ncbi:AAA family ATPase [Thioalkalicoccus limnaeus]|uniref:AAA family ATPase n=1 Tax=Thioalkalicoccus limnaeus TaxID=120681 RepID=A0ABV4BB40_9GAMM